MLIVMYTGVWIVILFHTSTTNAFAGLGVSMSRSCILNAIFFSAFEAVKSYINGLEVDERSLSKN